MAQSGRDRIVAYFLGVDIGTTYTAAAVWRDGRNDVANLGNRSQSIPSVVLLRDDGTMLVGEAADRRAATEPHRVAREFKRRLGDPTPIILGGTPYSADALIARLLRAVVDKVAEVEGGPPDRVAVSHPANWGSYKLDLLRQSIRLADLDHVVTLSEPEAAAIHYAAQARLAPGSVIAVYDLGGGTFDVAVLRKTEAGWAILGEPEGIERLGGVDFDSAVFHHVTEAVAPAVDDLDPDEPAAQAAVARLRQECVEAKEALSSDADVSIPVLLPSLQTEVRLTRGEYEQMVRPALSDTINAVHRALRSAKVTAEDLTSVLLVGGSSRTPLVGELVTSALGRPVAVDAHPKFGVALGAALTAAGTAGALGGPRLDSPSIADASPAEEAPPAAAAVPVVPTVPVATPAPAAPEPAAPEPAAPEPAATSAAATADPRRVTVPSPAARRGTAAPPPVRRSWPGPGAGAAAGGGDTGSGERPAARSGGSRRPLAIAVAGLAAVALAGVVILSLRPSDDDGGAGAGSPPETTAATAPATTPATAPTTEAAPEGPFVTISDVVIEGGRYRVNYEVANFGPDIEDPDELHIHFFLDTTEPENAGENGEPPGLWDLTDDPTTFVIQTFGPADRGAAQQLCGAVATHAHDVFERGTTTGNCVDLPD
ncbi:MAG TPA: Hsp70 family protein [Acidimicrobiales bacterium]|nr:Hsp70 family protein [Acidimicrobiales bacterium]